MAIGFGYAVVGPRRVDKGEVMKILVCGGRDYCDQEAIKKKLTELYERHPNSTLVHGGAPGADSWSGYIGGTLGFTVECHTAQWAKYGKAAGPIRNQEMLDGGIDLVVAFPGGRGTADMLDRARLTGVTIDLVDG